MFCFQEKDVPDADTLNKLSEHFRKEKESAVRVIILSVFGDIGALGGLNPQVLFLMLGRTFNETYQIPVDTNSRFDHAARTIFNR